MPLQRLEGETAAAMYVRRAEELLDHSYDPSITLEESELVVQKAQVYATLAVAMSKI